jgi:uncharacterized protein (TIGR03435 family)
MAFAKLTRLKVRTILFAAIGLAAVSCPMSVGMLFAQGVLAQPSEKTAPVSFKTASVKLSDSEGRCAPNRSVGQTFTVTNCPLGELILFAYDVLQQQVSGQTSLLGEEYDVTAKAEHAVSRSEMRRMLQTLLKDRFKLTLHRETKEIPVYALVVAKDGPKFHECQTASEGGPTPVKGSEGQLIFQNTAMSDIVFALSRRIADRIIVDKTGLTGKYDFDMTWYLKLGKPDPPPVFTAVQELGLQLEPQQSPVEFLVIDHVDKPSGN